MPMTPNPHLDRIAQFRPDIAEELAARWGFLTAYDVERPAVHHELRFLPVLVRCGNGRFVCGLQDVKHFVDIIGRDGNDYVRDVSLPEPTSWLAGGGP